MASKHYLDTRVDKIPSYIESDTMMRDFFNYIIFENKPPNKKEAITILNFLATFSIGCRELGLIELSDLLNKRAGIYYCILLRCGYKHTRKIKSNPMFSISILLTQAAYQLGIRTAKQMIVGEPSK